MSESDHETIHGLTKKNLLGAFPLALDKDNRVLVQAEITAEELVNRLGEIDLVRLYAAIDRMDAPLLDLLAYDFKVDWWNPDYTVEEKRRTLKDSWFVHKHLGTRAAVETAIRAIYPVANVREWFEYEGGRPYHFKILVDLSNEMCNETKPIGVMERVYFYKSLRSHLDVIEYTMEANKPAVLGLRPGISANIHIGIHEARDEFDFRSALHPAEAMGANTNVGVPEGRDEFDFRSALYPAEAMGTRTKLPVPEDVAAPHRVSILRTGGSFVMIAPPIFPTEEG